MKLNRQILLIIITLISMISNGIGQDIIPVLEEVSIVEGSSGNVKIRWRHETPSDIFIFRDSIEINVWVIIDSVKNFSVLEYTDNYANANSMNRVYKLRSTKESPDSKKFPTTFLSSTYDSCRAEINLTWSNSIPNFQYQPNVIFLYYEIFLKEGTGSYIKIGETSDQNFTIPDIKEKTNYSFYIAAIPEHAPNSKSTSNTIIDFYSEMAQPPAYINPMIASINSGIVHLEFDVDPNSELTKYKLLRSTSLSGPFDTIQSINSTSKRISVNDANANPDKRIYYYKLLAYNNCNQPIWEAESDIINTIFLDVTNADTENTLEWNALKEFSSPDCNYRIYRTVGNESPQLIAGPFNSTDYNDNIEDLVGTNAGSKICYFIIGRENTSQDPNNSNIACATIEPKVFIPEAFTPDGNTLNDFFDIKFSFLPENYTLIIYNRWSNIVFESTDPEKDWDGRSLNGNLVPSGAYIYYLKIVTESGKTIEKRGNITVIYP